VFFKRTAFALWLLATTAGPASAGDLVIPGTGDGLDMLRHLAADYTAKNPETRVIVPPSIGSGGGKVAVALDRVQLGRVAVPLSAADEANGMVAVSIVRVPTVFFAHASVRITDLTAHQTAEIFAGNIKSWAEVGGPDLRIRVVRREEADSTLQVLRATMSDWKDLVFTDRSKTAVTTQEAFETVSNYEGAIGFGPYSRTIEQQFHVLKINGRHPTSDEYPSFTTIRLIFKRGHISDEAKSFIKFATSAEAKQIFANYGGVPERPSDVPSH
jgi:phosphate transport system substrate-binding protein